MAAANVKGTPAELLARKEALITLKQEFSEAARRAEAELLQASPPQEPQQELDGAEKDTDTESDLTMEQRVELLSYSNGSNSRLLHEMQLRAHTLEHKVAVLLGDTAVPNQHAL